MLDGVFHAFEKPRFHHFARFYKSGVVITAVVESKLPIEQLVRTVLGWLHDKRHGTVKYHLDGASFRYTLPEPRVKPEVPVQLAWSGTIVDDDAIEIGGRAFVRLPWPEKITLATADAETLALLPYMTENRIAKYLADGTLDQIALDGMRAWVTEAVPKRPGAKAPTPKPARRSDAAPRSTPRATRGGKARTASKARASTRGRSKR